MEFRFRRSSSLHRRGIPSRPLSNSLEQLLPVSVDREIELATHLLTPLDFLKGR